MADPKDEGARDERVQQCLDLLQRSLARWSTYAVEASRLAWQWNFDAGEWTKAYATMWRGFAEDVDKVMKGASAERK